jgi:hypothetical protein
MAETLSRATQGNNDDQTDVHASSTSGVVMGLGSQVTYVGGLDDD